MTQRTTKPLDFSRLQRCKLVAEFTAGHITSDAGLLLLRIGIKRSWPWAKAPQPRRQHGNRDDCKGQTVSMHDAPLQYCELIDRMLLTLLATRNRRAYNRRKIRWRYKNHRNSHLASSVPLARIKLRYSLQCVAKPFRKNRAICSKPMIRWAT